MENYKIDSDFNFSIDGQDAEVSNNEGVKKETQTESFQGHNVQPQIPADNAPFIVLCGPPESGKSMVLKSLASYLYGGGLGYTIEANRTLLNTEEYIYHCSIFNGIISNVNIPMPNTVNYLLADIVDSHGSVVAHFLEAPGEDFFSINHSSEEPDIPFKSYMEKVAQTSANSNEKRKVIYIILLDLDSKTSLRNDQVLRQKYERKMIKLYQRFVLHHPSRVILLYNKVDLPQDGRWANTGGCSNPKEVYKDAERNYKNLFFKKKFLFWDIDDFAFLPYCTGSFPEDGSYTASGPVYPASLWNEITKRLW